MSSRRKKRPVFPVLLLVFGIAAAVTILSSFVFLVVTWFTTVPGKLMPAEGVPTPLDGSGRATVTPDVVRAGERVEGYTISYTAGEHGLMRGASIHLFYPSQIIVHGNKTRVYVPYLAWKSIREFMGARVSVHYEGKARIEVERPSILHRLRLVFGYYRSKWKAGRPAYSARDLVRELVRRTIRVTGGEVEAGDEITIKISARKGLSAPEYASWVNFSMSVDGDGDGMASLMTGSPRVVVVGRKAAAFRVVGTSVANIYEKIRVVVEAVDKTGQIDPTYTGIVYMDAPELALPGQTRFMLSDMGRKEFVVRTSRRGIFFVTARDDRGRTGRSNPIIIRDVGPHLYWGDLHIHSVLGMGDNSPDYVLRAARDELDLDFVAVDMIDSGIPIKGQDRVGVSDEVQFSWKHLRKITALFNKNDKFVAFPAFDWASNQLGHRLVIYSPGEVHTGLLSHADEHYDSVDKLLGALAGKRALVIPIWSGWRGGKFMGKKYDWGPLNARQQRLVEVYSSDGAVEFCDNPFPLHGARRVPHLFSPSDQASCSSGAFVRDALARGFRLGIIAGGARRFSLERPPFYSPGLAAVWAERLTAPEIWKNLHDRRAYGTTGARIFIEFKVDGHSPGEEVFAGHSVAIELFVVGTAPIERAQLIRFDGEYTVTRALSSKTEIIHTKWMETDPPTRGFYLLRVTQKDGQMAWAGPTWVSR